jgi:hypothetical protein
VQVQIEAPASMQSALRDQLLLTLPRHAFCGDYHFGTRSFDSEAAAF